MGNNDSKNRPHNSDENHLNNLFEIISEKRGTINKDNLKKIWLAKLDPQLYETFESYLFQRSEDEIKCHHFKRLYNELYKGDADEKAKAVANLIGFENDVPHAELVQFITRVLRSILIIEEEKGNKNYKSWSSRCSKTDVDKSLNKHGEYFLRQVDRNSKPTFDRIDLKKLLAHFDLYMNAVIGYLYQKIDDTSINFFPKWKYSQVDSKKQLEQFSLLNQVYIFFLNSELPTDFQNEWNLLFSTEIHGESFSRLSGQIINKGPTIIIVRDKKGHVFGGFAPHSWHLGPSFIGDSSSFLFTLDPDMNIFPASNFNSNFQYMNVGQQTMPNGLGMGGRLEYFGMWLDAEFGKGVCGESCTTFRQYKMMSATKDFDVSHVEVWAVGPPPPTAAELGERSVLDTDLEAKAILEMAGKQIYSEGLRDEPED